jgi:hypothetical protein
VTPTYADLARLDLRRLVDRVARIDPTAGTGVNWLLYEYHFRTTVIEHWDELDGAGLQRCAETFERLLTWLEVYGDVPRWMVAHRRFHLSTALLLRAGPQPAFPLTDPARLLRAALGEFPYPPEESRRRRNRSAEEHHARLHLPLLREAEHLFPPGPDLDTYRAWQETES